MGIGSRDRELKDTNLHKSSSKWRNVDELMGQCCTRFLNWKVTETSTDSKEWSGIFPKLWIWEQSLKGLKMQKRKLWANSCPVRRRMFIEMRRRAKEGGMELVLCRSTQTRTRPLWTVDGLGHIYYFLWKCISTCSFGRSQLTRNVHLCNSYRSHLSRAPVV